MPTRRFIALMLMANLASIASAAPAAMANSSGCGHPGQWLVPPVASATTVNGLSQAEILERLVDKPIVLLGETHDRANDHRWQLDMLHALHQQQPDMAIGFEMFPRRLQPVLDRWVAGELSEEEFLKQAEWEKVWAFDAQLYLPLFRFAKEHRLPMLALNVDRDLVKQVSSSGWSAVPESQREGVGQPAALLPAYREELRATFEQHPAFKSGKEKSENRFDRFLEAQALWDRAMAEGIARFRQSRPGTRVVGILGAGHTRHGYGVPHQLRDLGQDKLSILMTLPSDHACTELQAGLADAVHIIPPQPATSPPPRLGVALKAVEDGVMIEKVMPGSLAEQTGLKDGDMMLKAAGSKVVSIEDVRGHVYRQPPGTWLPLLIRRGRQTMEIVVRFPAKQNTYKPETPKH